MYVLFMIVKTASWFTHFASNAKAKTPAASGAAENKS